MKSKADNLVNGWRQLLARRCLAVDVGRNHLKALLVEARGRHVRILRHQMIDLQGEGLITPEEINRHLQLVVTEFGNYPVAFAIPQHMAISQVVDLPHSEDRDLKELIEQETINLSGLSESAIIYDYYPLIPHGKFHNPIWVTIAREREIREQISRYATTGAEIIEITTSANALISTYLAQGLPEERVVLVDLGATCTTVAIVDQGQGVFATSFPIGSESFTEAIANLKRCPFEEAEHLKRSQDLFLGGEHPLPGLFEVVDTWRRDLEQILRDWYEDNTDHEVTPRPLPVFLGGGGATQPGLLSYLRQNSVYDFQAWPNRLSETRELPLERFAVAYGAALETFSPAFRPASLLPQELRRAKRRQKQLLWANAACLLVLGVLGATLLFGCFQKLSLAHKKTRLIADAEVAIKQAQAIDTLHQQREIQYAKVYPIIRRQKNTQDVLNILQLLQQIREPRELWFVLLSDEKSYLAGTTLPSTEATRADAPESATATNAPALGSGFIVEVSIPDKGEEKLKPLNDLVAELKKQKGLFRKVDSLPANQRNTNLAPAKLLLPDRNYALALEPLDDGVREPQLPKSKKATSAPASPFGYPRN